MKIGLLAMSGIRAQDPELLEMGLTLPGFVERSKVIASLPSLGLLTLAGATPDGVAVEYVDVDDIPENDLPGEWDAVALSSTTARIKDTYALADRYRDAGIPVILGGIHVSACPGEAARHADAVVVGEAEGVWPGIVNDLRDRRLKPVYDGRRERLDLDATPLPRFDLLDPGLYNRITVQTQRGCPFDCVFCASSIRLAPGFRAKSPERVLAEVDAVRAIWDKPFLEFADDNTFADKARARKLLDGLASRDVRWFTETDISVADDPELLARLRDSGCAQLLIGLESPSQSTLTGVEGRGDWKAGRAESYAEAIRRIQAHGVSVNGCFVLGLDGAGPDQFDDILDFVRQSGLHEVQVTVMTPFPGTPLYESLLRQGRLPVTDPWESCTLFDVVYEPRGVTREELVAGLHHCTRELYNDDEVRRRRRSLREQWRQAWTEISADPRQDLPADSRPSIT